MERDPAKHTDLEEPDRVIDVLFLDYCRLRAEVETKEDGSRNIYIQVIGVDLNASVILNDFFDLPDKE
jgi:hypothetical protein